MNAAVHAVWAPAAVGVRRTWTAGARRVLAFVGPGYLVAAGYMDPGNWATSLSAGSSFGYGLLSVLLASCLMAMLLQSACVRLGVVTGRDLAQACRENFPPGTVWFLWIGCEIAIVACNIAEVLGMACGLNLVFHTPLPVGVWLTVLDVFVVLQLQRRGTRYLEAFVGGLLALIAVCFALQIWWLRPSLQQVGHGFIPTSQIFTRPEMMYLAVGIVGATVMPHNLYLHSWAVRSRRGAETAADIRRSLRYAGLDSFVALAMALAVNLSIMILAAGAFHRPGLPPVAEFTDAYRLLSPILGIGAASIVFGLGLIASGLSSSVTGALAGQIVMEGFLDVRLSRAKRAALTRTLALLPAAAVASWFGSGGVAKLLLASQVVLGIQLPFAMIPLLWLTTRKAYLGSFAFGTRTSLLLWSIAATLIAMNAWLFAQLL